MAETLLNNVEHNLPFISVITYGTNEYIGIINNQDQFVTSFYDIKLLKNSQETQDFLSVGEIWWWESNRKIPISVFCRDEVARFSYVIKTFNSKDVKIIHGPTVNLLQLSQNRIKRRSLQLVRRVR